MAQKPIMFIRNPAAMAHRIALAACTEIVKFINAKDGLPEVAASNAWEMK